MDGKIVIIPAFDIHGHARYTHVPSILETVGVPYVGSGPLAHSLALDKVVAKMLFVQWVNLSSRSNDPVGIRHAANEISSVMRGVGLNSSEITVMLPMSGPGKLPRALK